MNILMITRKVDRNDALAGFAYTWVKKLAKTLKMTDDHLYVICLEKGDTEGLPEHVSVFSLGKETGVNRFGRFLEFHKLAWRMVPKVDGIFCHMNPEYTIHIWPYAKLRRKKIVSWYTHGTVTWKTRLLEKMADVILTASQESFRVPSDKVVVTGHGIDTEVFHPDTLKKSTETFTILTVGRISPTKDLESIIKAVAILKSEGIKDFSVEIVGEPGLDEQFRYYENLRMMTRRMELEDVIHFTGPIPHKDIVAYYQHSDLFINLSGTGSIDKAVLEAMACECMVLTGNIAFQSMLPEGLLAEKNNPRALAERVLTLMQLPVKEKEQLKKDLRNIVVQHHNVDDLVLKIKEQFV